MVETDEEAIQGNSRTVYRRVATRLHLPAIAISRYPILILTIDPAEWAAAVARDHNAYDPAAE